MSLAQQQKKERPYKTLVLFGKMTETEQQDLMYKIGASSPEKQVEKLVAACVKGLNYQIQREKETIENVRRKQERSKREQKNIKKNLKRYGKHITVPHIRENMNALAKECDINQIKDIHRELIACKFLPELDDVERNSLSQWLLMWIEAKRDEKPSEPVKKKKPFPMAM